MYLRNFDGVELMNFYFTTVQMLFGKFSSEVENASCGTQFRYFKIKQVKSLSICLKILNYERPMQSYIKHRVKHLEQIEFKGSKSVSTAFLGTLTVFRCILHSVHLQKIKTTFIKLLNKSLPKDIGQELLIVKQCFNVSYFLHRLESVT